MKVYANYMPRNSFAGAAVDMPGACILQIVK